MPVSWKNRVISKCAACGTEGGKSAKGMFRPARRSGAPFGVAGTICTSCFQRLDSARRRQAVKLGQPTTKVGRAAALAQHLREASAFLPVVSGCPCHRFRMRFRVECDLCGVGGAIDLYSGAEWDIEGRICHQCREELRDERAEIRHRELAAVPCLSFASEDSHVLRKVCLPVLTPGFTRWDMTPKAAAALILAETKPVFRRAVSA
jgi:hypothetical protein